MLETQRQYATTLHPKTSPADGGNETFSNDSSDLEELTIAELKLIADEKGIEYKANVTKQQLIKLINKNNN